MSSTARLWAALGIPALAAGGGALWLVVVSDHESNVLVTLSFGLFVGWSFIASGLIAWTRLPENLTGKLLVAAGFSFFLGALSDSNHSVPFTIGLVTGAIPIAFVVHLLLTYPSGELRAGFDRWLVAVGYVAATTLPLIGTLFDADPLSCQECPNNAALIADKPRLADGINRAVSVIAIGILALVIFAIVRRWRAASPAARRSMRVVFLAGGGTMAIFVVQFAVQTFSEEAAKAISFLATVAFVLVPVVFLLGLLRSHLAILGVRRLVVELGQGVEPGALRDTLAAALHDPTLEIAYWLPERKMYVDLAAQPVEVSESGDRATTFVEDRGRPVAALVHDPALRADPQLLDAVVTTARLALENERLQAELRAQLVELAASRARIVEAADDARRKLERNLHDGAQQRLVSLSLSLRLAQSKLGSDPDAAQQILSGASAELTHALEELRELARGIHPAILTDRGLRPALEALAARVPLPVEIEDSLDGRLPAPVEAAAYYVVSESLANVAKYAQASSVQVRLTRRDGVAAVDVVDDGVGGADPAQGTGLRGLADRVEALNGRLELSSGEGGTRVRAEIPVRS